MDQGAGGSGSGVWLEGGGLQASPLLCPVPAACILPQPEGKWPALKLLCVVAS
jgi:hypothetical protein